MFRIPSAGVPVSFKDIMRGLFARDTAPFRNELARRLRVSHAGLVSSGSAAFYVTLKALSARSDRKEVVLPAYTAPVVILPVLMAGLKPVAADVSTETFNMDMESARDRVNANTLAVMPAHMFGIPCDMDAARKVAEDSGAALIEDAASAFGASINGRMAGTLGDAGFYSFHRGKQISTVIGGAWVTDDGSLAADIAREADALHYPTAMKRMRMFANLVGFALAVRPWFYSALHPLIARFKDTEPHRDFHLFAYTAMQAGVARSLVDRLQQIVAARNERANRAREILSGVEGITLPEVLAGTEPAYSHCPLLLPDARTRDKALAAALNIKVECTILYGRTIYQAYGLGADECGGADQCPKAEDLASRLLLIPCHPLIPMARVEQTAETIKNVVTRAPEAR